MSYTKGNWSYGDHLCSDGIRVFVRHEADNDQHDPICDLETWHTEDETEANARLISAAPDLLDACKLLVKEVQIFQPASTFLKDFTLNSVEMGLSAIAKAEGKDTK